MRTVGFLGVFFLINLSVGFYLFTTQSLELAVVLTPFFLIILLYNLLNSIILSRAKGFSIEQHRKLVEEFNGRGSFPKVAVMIPAAGEDLLTVKNTLLAATRINYPNHTVFLLDDSKEGMYKEMVFSTSAVYFRRAKTGFHKKAGNLNALMARIKDRGYEYVLVLDADFVASHEIISELIPYAKPDVGIVQSPQHFALTKEVYKRSKFEYGAALIQRDFYRITQSARNQMSGSICVGTNALYSIKALNKVGGFEGVGRKEWGHSEDVHTGLKMINTTNELGQRYRIEYIPIRLATGACPDNHLSFYKQQNRWATGSMQLALSRKTLFSRKLTISQKICYLTNSSYYFYTIALLFSPLQLLVLLLMQDSFDWQATLLFIPSLVLGSIIEPIVLRRHIRPIASSLVVLSNAYTFAQAFLLLLIKKPLGWEATGTKSHKKRNGHFIHFKILCTTFFIGVYLAVLGVMLLNQQFQLTPSIIISILFVFAFISHLIYLHHMLSATFNAKSIHRDIQAYVYALILALVVGVSTISVAYSDTYDIKFSRQSLIEFQPDSKKEANIEQAL